MRQASPIFRGFRLRRTRVVWFDVAVMNVDADDGAKKYPKVALAGPTRRPVAIAGRRASITIGGDNRGIRERFALIGAARSFVDGESLEECACILAAAGGELLWGPPADTLSNPHRLASAKCGTAAIESELRSLRDAADAHQLLLCAEATDTATLSLTCEYADALRIAPHDMQNFALLRAVGRLGRPVVLQRGVSATLDEWLLAAEYIADTGNDRIVLCESGIRHFDPKVPLLIDLHAVALLLQQTHLPIIVDLSTYGDRINRVSVAAPAHAASVAALARAAFAIGADGIVIACDACEQISDTISSNRTQTTPFGRR